MARTAVNTTQGTKGETEEIERWRTLADQYLKYYSDELELAQDQQEPAKKDPLSSLLLRVSKLREQSEDGVTTSPEKNLRAWRMAAKAVIASVDRHHPGWCYRGDTWLNEAKRLLGMPVLRQVRITVSIDEKILDTYISNSHQLRVTVSTSKGQVLAQGVEVDDIGAY